MKQKNLELQGLNEYDQSAREIAHIWLERIARILDDKQPLEAESEAQANVRHAE